MTVSLAKAKLEGWQAFGRGFRFDSNLHVGPLGEDAAANNAELAWAFGARQRATP